MSGASVAPPGASVASAAVRLLLAHLTRLQVQQEAVQQADAAIITAAKDGNLPTIRRQQQSEALRTVLQFLCANDPAYSGGDAALELLTAVWQVAHPKITSLLTSHAEQKLKKSSSTADGAKGKRAPRAGGGGKIPANLEQQLEHQRSMIYAEQTLWIYLETVRLLAQMIAEQKAQLAAAAIASSQSIVTAITQLLHPSFVQSHDIAVRVLTDTASLSPAIHHQVQQWDLKSLESTCSVLPASEQQPDARPLCALTALLVQSAAVDSHFDADVWRTACAILQSAPSIYVRQSVLRELVPILLLSATSQRPQQLLEIFRGAWLRAIEELEKRPKAKSSVSYMHATTSIDTTASASSSLLLSAQYLGELQSVVPQLDLLYDVLCAHYSSIFSSLPPDQRRVFDGWLLDAILCGLSSGVTVAKKQCIYLLQLRLQHRQSHSPACFIPVDYTPEQWSAFHHLFSLFESASLHLLEQGFERVQTLLAAPRETGRFLEMLMWKIFSHEHPGMSTYAFQQIHEICFQKKNEAASSASSTAPSTLSSPSYGLSPSTLFGPLLSFFSSPSLFSPDKLRRGAHRVGDALWRDFLVEYMKELPVEGEEAEKVGAPCTRPQFIRSFLHSMCNQPALSSVISLCVQLSALAQLEPTHCMTEEDVQLLWLLTHYRVQEASSRLRMELMIYTLQIFCRHTDFSAKLSVGLVARIMGEWPAEWMRPNGASFQLLLVALNGPNDWLGKNILQAIGRHFDLIDSGAALSEVHAASTALSRLLLFVPASLSSSVLQHLLAGLPSPASSAAPLRLFAVFDLLCTYFSHLAEARQRQLAAPKESELEWLETICIPTSASSYHFVDAADRARISATSWQGPLEALAEKITAYGTESIDRITQLCQLSSSDPSFAAISSLPAVLSSLLAHSSLATLRQRLLRIVWRRIEESGAWTKASTVEANEGFMLGALLHAIAINCTREDFSTDSAASSSSSTADSLPLSSIPAILSRLLHAQPGQKPAHQSNDEWKSELQQFHIHRWKTVEKLLEVECRTEENLIAVCIDSLDGATEFFVESIFHCIRLLLPSALTQEAHPLEFLEQMYSAAWNAFRDLHLQLPSYTATLAFLALLFETTSFRLPANHSAESGPFATYLRILLSYGARHTRFLVYVCFFATAAWMRYPWLLKYYTSELLEMSIFIADSSLEVDLIEEKLSAYALAHLIHNYSDVSKVTEKADEQENGAEGEKIVASTGLRRAESLVRCLSLHFLQLLPQRMVDFPLGSSESVAIHEFLSSFSTALLQHPQLLSSKGCVAGEGNLDFVQKCFLWQTACVFARVMPRMESGAREEMHEKMQKCAWEWHDRPIASVLRHYVESFLSLLYTIAPQRIEAELVPHLVSDAPRPTLLASLILILSRATLSISDPVRRSQQGRRTILLLHPFCACNFGHVRLVGQYLYYRVVQELAPPEWKGDSAASTSSSSADGECIRSMMQYLSHDTDMIRLRERQDAYFAHFNPNAASTVLGIMAGAAEDHYFMPKPLLEQLTGVQGEYLSTLRDSYDDRKYLVNGPIDDEDAPAQSAAASASSPSPASSATADTNYQQKIDVMPLQQLTALGDIAGGGASEPDGAEDSSSSSAVTLRTAVTSQSSRQRIIVIASLCTKVPNLAGLSRTCEIFRAEQLMVADETVVHDREFKSVSVTAHKWLDICELKPEGIRNFMLQKKEEGYTCIALEQSAASIRLPEFQFPSRVVLLLGAEKEGVPLELLNLVDHSVEIPQLGIIRSLNVHVSGSILLWEYTRQQLLGLAAPA